MKHLFAVLLLALTSNTLHAKQIWSSVSLSYLQGSNYELGDPKRNVFTIEAATGQSWGDTFLFVDRLSSNNGDSELYTEIGARFSVFNFGDEENPTNVLLATQLESGTKSIAAGGSFSFENYLVGPSISWPIPGFKYFSSTLYYRNNDTTENNEQITFTWGYPFSVGNTRFLIDGFCDYTTDVGGDSAYTLNFTPQVKLDFGRLVGLMDGELYVGVEYVYWRNKYNISGVDERNPNFLLKWHF